MSGLGGYCPLPIRLGGSATEGLTAEQLSRLAADLAAIKNTARFAVVVYTPTGSPSAVSIDLCRTRFGVGSAFNPSTTYHADGDITLTFAPSYEDEYGRVFPTSLWYARIGINDNGQWRSPQYTITEPHKIRIRTPNWAGTLSNVTVTAAIYADPGTVDIGDYDGALDKKNCSTEAVPYAWTFYRELQGMRGSAFNTKLTGFVHAENFALARSHAGRFRAGEKLSANSIPSTADERLETWQEILNVGDRAGESRHKLRQRCAARFRVSQGNDEATVDNAVEALLGPAFVRSWRQIGASLAVPPLVTYWPGINPGPTSYGISTNASGTPTAWLSERCHYVVEVQIPSGMPVSEFLYLVNVELFDMLDSMLPAWATFDWALTPLAPGFLLDVTQMDFGGLAP